MRPQVILSRLLALAWLFALAVLVAGVEIRIRDAVVRDGLRSSAGTLNAMVRSGEIRTSAELHRVLDQIRRESGGRIAWITVKDSRGRVVAQCGNRVTGRLVVGKYPAFVPAKARSLRLVSTAPSGLLPATIEMAAWLRPVRGNGTAVRCVSGHDRIPALPPAHAARSHRSI